MDPHKKIQHVKVPEDGDLSDTGMPSPITPHESMSFLFVKETEGNTTQKSESGDVSCPWTPPSQLEDSTTEKLLKSENVTVITTDVSKNNKALTNNNVKDPSGKDPFLDAKEQKGAKRYFGILCALAAAVQFSLSALVIKILKYHPFNLGVWRFGVMTCIPIPFLIHTVFIKKENVMKEVWPVRSTTVFVMLQAILGANSIIFVFFGLKYMNIADSIVIGTSAPVFVSLFAFIFLGERCGVVPGLTAMLALIGVGIISKPPILTGAEHMSDDLFLGVASSFSSMILLTICYVIIRYIRSVHHALVNFVFSLWGLLQCVIMAQLMGVLELPKSYQEVILLLVTAALAFFAQTCITLALKYEQAGPVALVRTMVVFAFCWQALFLGVRPDYLSVIGAVVTLSGVILTALRKTVMSLPDNHKYKKRFRFLLY